MTNEELDRARAEHAWSEHYKNDPASPTVIAARLAREGWTPPEPPEPVDPDLLEARRIAERVNREADYSSFAEAAYLGNEDNSEDVLCALAGIKRGRALAAEAKPRMVWVRYDGSGKRPIDRKALVMVVYGGGDPIIRIADGPAWEFVSHYAVITPPAEDE